MPDLISRLEGASEGSRELDDGIAAAVYPERQSVKLEGWPDDMPGMRMFAYPDGSVGSSLRFTTSLDAALTLVPEGCEIEMTNLYGVARVGVGLNCEPGPFYGSNECGSLPCAVVASALKARESNHG